MPKQLFEDDPDEEEPSEDQDSGSDGSDAAEQRPLTHGGRAISTREGDEFDSGGEGEEDAGDQEDGDEAEEDEAAAPMQLPGANLEEAENPADVAARIKELAAALADFNAFKKRTKAVESRAELVEQLCLDCAVYYGYLPELLDLFLTLFGPSELVEFLEANETPRPTVIRANTLKTTRKALAQALTARGVGLEPVGNWTNVGLKVFESTVPVGATPEYLAGHYMLQSASSLTPVLALAPEPGEKVLDMCASPGGKTTHIAQLMKNKGVLVANDAKKLRMGALVANLARMGVTMAACVNHDGRDFPKVMGGFDRVLLDAPCSGLGVISHDPSVKQTRTLTDIQETAHLQKQLLLCAIDSCKTGGVVVYSTCSISVQENEQVVQYALERRNVKIVEFSLDFGRPGLVQYMGRQFHKSMALAKRLYPHVLNMDGFFICKMIKLGPGEKKKQHGVWTEGGEDDDADEPVSEEETPVSNKQTGKAKAKPKQAKEGAVAGKPAAPKPSPAKASLVGLLGKQGGARKPFSREQKPGGFSQGGHDQAKASPKAEARGARAQSERKRVKTGKAQ